MPVRHAHMQFFMRGDCHFCCSLVYVGSREVPISDIRFNQFGIQPASHTRCRWEHSSRDALLRGETRPPPLFTGLCIQNLNFPHNFQSERIHRWYVKTGTFLACDAGLCIFRCLGFVGQIERMGLPNSFQEFVLRRFCALPP